MAKMIPATIERNDPRRHGEYLVYDWMSDPQIPGYCFYSLPQKNHKHKMIGEVDFLYVCEQGMLCIEVKGGQDIYREGREWYSVNMKGEHNQIKDPFVQSRECMYALGRYLQDVYGSRSEEAQLQRGYCVVFPECISGCKGNDLVLEVMYDNRYELAEFKNFLKNSLGYWARLEEERHFGNGSRPLTPKQVQKMVDLLQADFGSVPSMKLEIQHIEDQMLALSDEQLDIVEDMHENKRLLVRGAAGTGKSLIALAKVRCSLAENKRVLYVCYNRNMARYAKANLPQDNECLEVKTFHSLLGAYLERDVYKCSKKELCTLFAEAGVAPQKFDVLVVDEGQDLMADYVWDVLDGFLEKGLERGEWAVFTDPNQSIFTGADEYTAGIEYLKELYNPAVYPLTKNWRNTKQIARRTSRLTAVPPSRHMKIDGPKVVAKRYIESDTALVKQLKKDVQSLLMGGTSAKSIVILSARALDRSSLRDVGEMCNLNIVEFDAGRGIKNGELSFSTVHAYKGLEASVVLYIDIPGFKSIENRQLNYVAMSRARALLYMYINEELDDEYDNMMDEGLDVFD